MIKDFLGRECDVGDYFAYPLTVGRSANMALYQLKEIRPNGSVKAHKIDASYGFHYESKYKKWIWDNLTNTGEYVDMTEAERAKVDAKLSTLGHFEKRACKTDYTPGEQK